MVENEKINYKLIYYEERGKIDLIKLLFKISDHPYEDIQIKLNDWNSTYKPWVPFEQLPVLVINNQCVIVHSSSICRYLAKKFGLNGLNDYESALCDMIVEELKECIDQVMKIVHENDNIKRIELENKFINEKLNRTLDGFEKLLSVNLQQNSKFIVGNNLTWADVAIVNGWEWLNDKCKQLMNSYPLVQTHGKFIKTLPKISEWYKEQKPLYVTRKV